MELAMLQVSDPAMNQSRRTSRRPAREIVSFDECHAEAAHRGVTCDSATGNPATDHENIEFLCGESSHFLAMARWRLTRRSIRNLTARFGYRAIRSGSIVRVEEQHKPFEKVRIQCSRIA